MSRSRADDDPVLAWAVAHPEESRALGTEFVVVAQDGELVDHDASFEALYARACESGRMDMVLGRLIGAPEAPGPSPRERLAAVFASQPWMLVEQHAPLRKPEIAELRSLIEALAK